MNFLVEQTKKDIQNQIENDNFNNNQQSNNNNNHHHNDNDNQQQYSNQSEILNHLKEKNLKQQKKYEMINSKNSN